MGIFAKSKEVKQEYIAVFLLRQQDVRAWVCSIDYTSKAVQLIDEKKTLISPTWDTLVYDVDEMLFAFEKEHDIKLQKATFFVFSHLIDDASGELQNQYMDVLKNVLIDNNLESLGYIEIEESLALMYESTEHTPLNAVLLEVDISSVFACVYKGGRKIFHQTVAKSSNVLHDIDGIFTQMPESLLLPARIIMYDSPSVEHESHDLLMHTWDDKRFIQIPQIGVVKDLDLTKAIIQGVSQEVFGVGTSRAFAPALEIGEQEESNVIEPASIETSESSSIMGFVIGADVRTDVPSATSPHIQQDSPQDDFRTEPGNPQYHMEPATQISENQQQIESDGLKTKITDILYRMRNVLKNVQLRGNNKHLKKIIIGLVMLGFILGSIGAVGYFAHSAQVSVIYSTDVLEDTIQFVDEITLTEHSESISASAKQPTSGTDDVGEKARGTFVIYNADDKAKTFDKGAKITSSDGLVFTIDKAVTVEGAKKTITDEENILTSTSKASVPATAEDIGPKYNIKKDTKLKIEGFSDTTYFAKSEAAFEGGSSKQIQTVDKDDYKALDAKIKKEIDEKSAEILNTISKSGGVVKDLTVVDTRNQTYSKEIDEEADVVSSQVKAKVVFYSLEDEQVKTKLLETLSESVPDGYTLDPRNITFTVSKAVQDSKTKKVTLTIRAKASPQLEIDSERVRSAIKGMKSADAEMLVRKDFKAEGIDARVSSPIPFLHEWIPFFEKNITIDLKALN